MYPSHLPCACDFFLRVDSNSHPEEQGHMAQLSPEQQTIASDVKAIIQTWQEGYGLLSVRVQKASLDDIKSSLKDVKSTELAKSYKELFNAMTQCQQHKLDQRYTKEATDAFHQSKGLLASQSGDWTPLS